MPSIIKKTFLFSFFSLFIFNTSTSALTPADPVENRITKEKKIPPNHFSVVLYKPNYLLPFYFTASPDYSIYRSNTPNNENLMQSELKFQFSAKVSMLKNIFHRPSSLWLAYTQQSYWQAYNHRAFFRESNYEPEIFLSNEMDYSLIKSWHLKFLNLGAVHQSNGFGNSLERGWNRLYLEAIASTEHWMVSVKPWYVIDTDQNNDNIANFLGHGRVLLSYKFRDHIFSLAAHSFFEKYGKRTSAELTWSFPLTAYVKGYAQFFSGYGQSLIEYNHRTNSAGIGVALSDWV